MNISVEYKDSSGAISNRSFHITRLAFAKHMAFAGQGYAPFPNKLIRTISMFFHYISYLQRQNFYNNRFSVPPNQLYDPTEKGQFSNIVGKAIADYLSKKINHSLITVNYEAAMKLRNMRLNVRRPDLIAYSQNSMFAIEAKGYSKSSSGNMNIHKDQSRTGGIPVNFSVACVSYNIYKEIKCKYFDPYNEDVPYDLETLSRLSKNYYYGLSGFLDNEFFDYRKIEINGEDFYAVELSYRIFEKLLHDSFLYPRIHFCVLLL